MADCINMGNSEPKFTTLDGTEAMPSSGPAGPGKSRRVGLGSVCAILYFVLLTAIAVIAFILGIYATDKVKGIREPDAVLVSNPSLAPSGYTAYSLGSGLGYWSPADPMKFKRSDHGVISYGKYAYLIGGLSDAINTTTGKSQATVLDTVVRYDTETGNTTFMKSMPEARYRFAYALLNGTIYVMGGTGVVAGGPTDTVYTYDIEADQWDPVPKKLAVPRVDACGAAVNGKVYVFGGYDEAFHSMASTEVYVPGSATPTDKGSFQLLPSSSNLITSRGDCRAVPVNNMIYAVGGVEWYNNTSPGANCSDNWVLCYRFLKSVEAFNPGTERWSSRRPMFNTRGDFGIETLPGNRIIVAGGEKGNGAVNGIAMYEVEEYIVDDDVWVQKAPLPEARFRDDLASVNGRVYAFGGSPTCPFFGDDNQCFILALDTVLAYFDVQYPRLYAFYKPAANTTN